MITVERVDTEDGLAALETPWTRLLARCPYQNVYMSHPWNTAWWRHFGAGRTLSILVFRRSGEIVALAPLTLARTRLRGLPLRQLGFPLNGCSLQCDLIVPEDRDEVCRALVGYLADTTREWDVLCLDGLSHASGHVEALERAAAGSAITMGAPIPWESAVLTVEGDWAGFLESRNTLFRRKLKQSHRRLAELGGVEYRRFDDPAGVQEGLTRLIDLERRSWKIDDAHALSRQEEAIRFFRDVAERYSSRGHFQVRIIERNGEAIAGNFVVIHEGTVYGLKTWYDQAFARVSPGRALFEFLIKDSWESGMRQIYLDRRTPFMEPWSSETERYYKLWVFHRRPYSRLLGRLREAAGRRRPIRE